MDKWLELRIYTSPDKKEQTIKLFVDPLIKHCDNVEGFTSFHFLGENGKAPHLLLRLLGDEDALSKNIRPWMKEKVKELQLEGKFTDIGDYPGEEAAFGKEGWVITYKLFEWASRGELIRLNPNIKKGPLFREGKLIHCFLNCWGYNVGDEFRYHLRSSLERMLVSRGVLSPEREEVKKMIKELDETVPNIISEIIDNRKLSA